MSTFPKSIHKSKKSFYSPKKQFATLMSSIKKYEAKFNTLHSTSSFNSLSSSYVKNGLNGKQREAFTSQNSPNHIFKTEYDFECLSKSSDTSVDTFREYSFEDEGGNSFERSTQSPVALNGKKQFEDRDKCENKALKSRPRDSEFSYKLDLFLEKSEKRNSDYNKELDSKLQKQQRVLKERYREELEKNRGKIVKEFQNELKVAKHDIKKRLHKKYKKLLGEREVEMKQKFRKEVVDLQSEHEDKLKEKIKDLTGDYERQLIRINEEVTRLRKQNDHFKRQVEESNTRVDLVKNSNRTEGLITNSTIDQTKELNEIYQAYNQLQHDYLELKNKKQINVLCSKCKAFTITDSDLSNKMSRIRAYIDSQET